MLYVHCLELYVYAVCVLVFVCTQMEREREEGGIKSNKRLQCNLGIFP